MRNVQRLRDADDEEDGGSGARVQGERPEEPVPAKGR